MSVDHIHATYNPDGHLSTVDAVGAIRIEPDETGHRILIDTEHGESLVLHCQDLTLEIHEIPPVTETVTISDPFHPDLFALTGGCDE